VNFDYCCHRGVKNRDYAASKDLDREKCRVSRLAPSTWRARFIVTVRFSGRIRPHHCVRKMEMKACPLALEDEP